MIAEGVLQFLAAGNRDCSLFGVIFRSKRALSSLRIYRRDRLAYLLDFCPWTGCRGHSGKFCRYCIYYACFRIGSTVRKCPVTLFLIAGIFPEVPGIGIYRTIYYSLLENNKLSLHYGRETLGVAIAMVLGIILVFEIPQKTINGIFQKNKNKINDR